MEKKRRYEVMSSCFSIGVGATWTYLQEVEVLVLWYLLELVLGDEFYFSEYNWQFIPESRLTTRAGICFDLNPMARQP